MANKIQIRTEFEQKLVNAFIDAKAINFEVIGGLFQQFGEEAAKTGTTFTTIINKNFIINCGWPGPELGQILNQRGE